MHLLNHLARHNFCLRRKKCPHRVPTGQVDLGVDLPRQAAATKHVWQERSSIAGASPSRAGIQIRQQYSSIAGGSPPVPHNFEMLILTCSCSHGHAGAWPIPSCFISKSVQSVMQVASPDALDELLDVVQLLCGRRAPRTAARRALRHPRAWW